MFAPGNTRLEVADWPNPNFQFVCGRNLATMLVRNMIASMWAQSNTQRKEGNNNAEIR